MNLRDRINNDFKQAMLARDNFKKTTLNGLKSAIKYAEVAQGAGTELDDAAIEKVVAKEVKSRTDAAAVYQSAGDAERASKESAERDILLAYLPKQLTEDELRDIVNRVVTDNGFDASARGQVIGAVKKEVGTSAEGSLIAKVVGEYFK